MSDTSGHDRVHVVARFNRWWPRKFGVPAWYRTPEGECHESRVWYCRNGQLMMRMQHYPHTSKWYNITYEGGIEWDKTNAFIPPPLVQWWFE